MLIMITSAQFFSIFNLYVSTSFSTLPLSPLQSPPDPPMTNMYQFYHNFSPSFSLQYISFSPGHIVAADLCFLRPISSIKRTAITPQKKYTTVLVLLDIFSRFLQLRVLSRQTAEETYTKFKEALPFFGDHEYKHLLTDRVSQLI